MKQKTVIPIDKRAWHPSPLMGQVVLVTTIDEDGGSNVAPKSWISMMAFEPPILAIGCNLKHRTAQNILAQREFVINVPGFDLAEVVWRCHELPHPRPVEAAGFAAIPAVEVKPPRIEECRAHLECVLDKHVSYGDEILLLGEIVAGSIDQDALQADDPYSYLQMFVHLEDRTLGVVQRARRLS